MKLRYRILNSILLLLVLGIAAVLAYVSHDSPCGAAPPAPGAGTPSMKAMVYRCYGSMDVVKLETLPKAPPASDRVLVRVHAAAVNPLDWHYVRGKPYIMRPMIGIGAPADVRLGTDFEGTVEAVGDRVTQFKVGDEVFGGADGAFAQYVSVRATGAIALKPPNVTGEQAASVGIAGVTALQALRDKGKLQAGQKVLVNGASGGVGTFAVQIAKAMGAEVTGVCSAKNAAMVQGIGADHVIDYTHEDFTQGKQQYDLIIDPIGNHTLAELRRVLTPNGVLVMIGGASDNDWLGPLTGSIKAKLSQPFHRQQARFMLAELNQADLNVLRDLMASGKLMPVIDRTYPLSETPEAIRYVEAGHSRGKVVVSVD